MKAKDGGTRFSLDVFAEDVEFLSPRSEGQGGGGRAYAPSDADDASGNDGFQEVDDDDLPF